MPDRMDAGLAGFSQHNAATLDRMVGAIDLAEGFTLFIACCNAPAMRGQLIDAAAERLAGLRISLVEVTCEGEIINLRQCLRERLAAADEEEGAPGRAAAPAPLEPLTVREPGPSYAHYPKRAIFVTGLEYGIPYNQPNTRILAQLNLGRDLFPRDVPHPLVLWLPDYAVTAVARHAPDFWAWRSGVFEFETGDTGRTAVFEQHMQRRQDQSWHALTNLSPEARLLRQRQLESLLDDYRDLPDDLRVARERLAILSDLGNLYTAAQDYSDALSYLEQALGIARRVDDQAKEADLLDNIGMVYDALGDKPKALQFFEQALPLLRQVGHRAGEATTLNNIGMVYDALGDKPTALQFYEQALPLQRQVGDRAGEAATLTNIGGVYSTLGDKPKALQSYQEALSLRRQGSDRAGEAITGWQGSGSLARKRPNPVNHVNPVQLTPCPLTHR